MSDNKMSTDPTEPINSQSASPAVNGQGTLADRLSAIGRAAAPEWCEPFRSTEHGDLLYGEDGLPK